MWLLFSGYLVCCAAHGDGFDSVQAGLLRFKEFESHSLASSHRVSGACVCGLVLCFAAPVIGSLKALLGTCVQQLLGWLLGGSSGCLCLFFPGETGVVSLGSKSG